MLKIDLIKIILFFLFLKLGFGSEQSVFYYDAMNDYDTGKHKEARLKIKNHIDFEIKSYLMSKHLMQKEAGISRLLYMIRYTAQKEYLLDNIDVNFLKLLERSTVLSNQNLQSLKIINREKKTRISNEVGMCIKKIIKCYSKKDSEISRARKLYDQFSENPLLKKYGSFESLLEVPLKKIKKRQEINKVAIKTMVLKYYESLIKNDTKQMKKLTGMSDYDLTQFYKGVEYEMHKKKMSKLVNVKYPENFEYKVNNKIVFVSIKGLTLFFLDQNGKEVNEKVNTMLSFKINPGSDSVLIKPAK